MDNAQDTTDLEVYNASLEDAEPEVTEAPEGGEQLVQEPVAEAEARTERERDELGRFKAKQPEEAPREEKQDHRIPLAELMKERDSRQAAQRELDHLRQQFWAMQQQMQQAQAPKEEPIDIFAQPEVYQAHIQQTMEQRLRAMEGNFSLRLAAYKHGDSFHEAWQEMARRSQSGDDSIRQQVINSPDPGETLVQLYQREKVIGEVGSDPNAYIQKKLDEALKDPAFLAKAVEAARTAAGAQPTQNKIELPRSLNKLAGSHSAPEDHTDRGMYNFATR